MAQDPSHSTASASAKKEFQRAYKACIPCRKRKAKCEVSDELGPPCQRCRRELRECIFSEERSWTKKRKRGGEGDDAQDEHDHITPPVAGISPVVEDKASPHVRFHPSPSGNHHSHEDNGTAMRPTRPPWRGKGDPAAFRTSVMRHVVSNSKDALDILFQAAEHAENGRPEDTQSEAESVSTANFQAPQYETPGSVFSGVPAVHTAPLTKSTPEVLRAWNTCRFVRMGWFTAEEALTYVDLFFKHMHQMSPILTDFYGNHENHRTLINEEPVLCTTLLMISSRYNNIEGAGGMTRGYFIHHKLWEHLQRLIMKIMLGQEKGKFAKTRNVGSIEALLLIVEWHPRMFHFPPEIDGWDSDLAPPDLEMHGADPATKATSEDAAASNKWLADVIESVRRSDRMSWMLVGTALTLAHERGVFDDERKLAIGRDELEADKERATARFMRTKKLLYVYTEQLSSRLGHTSMIPQGLNQTVQGRRAGAAKQNDEWQLFMTAWIDLTKLLKSVSDMFFPSSAYTKQILNNGKYLSLLEHFQPLLDQWKSKHLENHNFSYCFQEILHIEFQYVRIYMNSLGMQAVVERNMSEAESGAQQADVTDYEFIQEVVDGSCEILERIIKIADAGSLRYAPVRLFLRIVSSSIFLVKGLSLGAWNTKVQSSLDVLSRTIQALRVNALDEMHLSLRYAELLEIHHSRLRRSFKVSSRPPRLERMNLNAETEMQNSTMDGTSMPMNQPQNPGYQPQPDMAGNTTMPNLGDDWLTLPFDPNLPAFGFGGLQSFPGLDDGTLDFIWNFPA